MRHLDNIELDLLFRIDFFELTGYGETDMDDSQFERQKKLFKDKYGFKNYFQRRIQDFEYIRLSELEEDLSQYKKYLIDLRDNEKFDCCQLEQAIGLFQKGQLKAFLSTDTGRCYNSLAHFDSVEEILTKGESDLGDINTFYGKLNGDLIEILYSPRINNIDISNDKEFESFYVNKKDFELKFSSLRERASLILSQLNNDLKLVPKTKKEHDFIDEVFTKKLTKA